MFIKNKLTRWLAGGPFRLFLLLFNGRFFMFASGESIAKESDHLVINAAEGDKHFALYEVSMLIC